MNITDKLNVTDIPIHVIKSKIHVIKNLDKV